MPPAPRNASTAHAAAAAGESVTLWVTHEQTILLARRSLYGRPWSVPLVACVRGDCMLLRSCGVLRRFSTVRLNLHVLGSGPRRALAADGAETDREEDGDDNNSRHARSGVLGLDNSRFVPSTSCGMFAVLARIVVDQPIL